MAAEDPKEAQDENRDEGLNNPWINIGLGVALVVILAAVVLYMVTVW